MTCTISESSCRAVAGRRDAAEASPADWTWPVPPKYNRDGPGPAQAHPNVTGEQEHLDASDRDGRGRLGKGGADVAFATARFKWRCSCCGNIAQHKPGVPAFRDPVPSHGRGSGCDPDSTRGAWCGPAAGSSTGERPAVCNSDSMPDCDWASLRSAKSRMPAAISTPGP